MVAKWLIIAWITLGTVVAIANIGKPQKPTTAGTAVAVVVINVAIIAAMAIGWQP